MSTFSGLNTAYTGLVAAKAGLDVVGQNLVNANTAGYTRQRVTTSGVPALNAAGLFTGGVRPGQGVSVDGIQRLDDAALDARVRSTTALSGYSSVRATALTTLEDSLHEPGTDGLSAQLQKFWSAWGDVANQAGDQAPAGPSGVSDQSSSRVRSPISPPPARKARGSSPAAVRLISTVQPVAGGCTSPPGPGATGLLSRPTGRCGRVGPADVGQLVSPFR